MTLRHSPQYSDSRHHERSLSPPPRKSNSKLDKPLNPNQRVTFPSKTIWDTLLTKSKVCSTEGKADEQIKVPCVTIPQSLVSNICTPATHSEMEKIAKIADRRPEEFGQFIKQLTPLMLALAGLPCWNLTIGLIVLVDLYRFGTRTHVVVTGMWIGLFYLFDICQIREMRRDGWDFLVVCWEWIAAVYVMRQGEV